MAEDKIVGWHHQVNGPGFEQVSGDGEDREDWRAAALEDEMSQTPLSY